MNKVQKFVFEPGVEDRLEDATRPQNQEQKKKQVPEGLLRYQLQKQRTRLESEQINDGDVEKKKLIDADGMINNNTNNFKQCHEMETETEEDQDKNIPVENMAAQLRHPQPKKKPKNKMVWLNTYKLHSIEMPQLIPEGVKTKYKYKITFQYLKTETNVDKSKQIKKSKYSMKIGRKGEKYLCEGGVSEEHARLLNSRFQKWQTPFDKNYWVICLLNSHTSLKEAYINFLNKML